MTPFEKWLQAVDLIMVNCFGLDHDDLDDWHWAEAFEDGLSPREAVESYAEDYELEDLL